MSLRESVLPGRIGEMNLISKASTVHVFEIINRTKLIPIPPQLDSWYHLYQNTPETIYASNTSIEAFLNLDYAQFIAVKDFLHPEAQYSTEHGVKGEEYDNVIFVISKGWNQYQFETYAPMITKKLSYQVENKLPLSVTAIYFMYVVQGQRKG